MPTVASLEVFAVDLPFRVRFKHAAHERRTSSSLFLKCHLDSGEVGWGEALPRPYVTGEKRDESFALLRDVFLPRLVGRSFESYEDLVALLESCDGQAPVEWLDPATPQSAAWCCVDLALLDAFGKFFKRHPLDHVEGGDLGADTSMVGRYSGVLTSGGSWKRKAQLLGYRVLGFEALKLKVDSATDADNLAAVRRLAGRKMSLRADANMGWSVDEALQKMPMMAEFGVTSFEQPLEAGDLDGAAQLIRETGLDVMADESLTTRASLERLVEHKAATAINARISKCGGLVATLRRCREAQAAGLWVQVGCQVGESSLLSASHLRLCRAFGDSRYREGCFGRLLLEEDPFRPLLQMKIGGRPPQLPAGFGHGLEVDEDRLVAHSSMTAAVDSKPATG